MWFKNLGSKAEAGEDKKDGDPDVKNEESAIDYDDEEEQKKDLNADEKKEEEKCNVNEKLHNEGEENIIENRESTNEPDQDSDVHDSRMNETQINERIDEIINNLSSDEEEEGEVVEDEIPYDRVEENNEVNKEVILLNFYYELSNQKLELLVNVFGKVKNMFTDDNEGIHVIFYSIKSAKKAKEYLDNFKIKNRRIQVIYGTYKEGVKSNANISTETKQNIKDDSYDKYDLDNGKENKNDSFSHSGFDHSGNINNAKTPVKLFKNKKYYMNNVHTFSHNNMTNNFSYKNQTKGIIPIPHMKNKNLFVAPSANLNTQNEITSSSELSLNHQEKIPTSHKDHNRSRSSNRGMHHNIQHNSSSNLHLHQQQHQQENNAHLETSNFNNASNYVQPPPPPPPRSLKPYNKPFNDANRNNLVESFPKYNHHQSNNHQHSVTPVSSEHNRNKITNGQPLLSHGRRKMMSEQISSSFIQNTYNKNGFEVPSNSNTPYVSYTNQPPTSNKNVHHKRSAAAPLPPHIHGANHTEMNMPHSTGGKYIPMTSPEKSDMSASAKRSGFRSRYYGNHPNPENQSNTVLHGKYTIHEEYEPQAIHPKYEESYPHAIYTVNHTKHAKYTDLSNKHNSRHMKPPHASERVESLSKESFEYSIQFNEENPFGIHKDNQVAENPTWNHRKTKPVLKWDPDASVEANHLDFVETFGNTKIYNRYLLITNIPEHLDQDSKVKEYVNGLFSKEKVHSICVEVTLFIANEIDEHRFFKNAKKREDPVDQDAAVTMGDEVNQEITAMQGEVQNVDFPIGDQHDDPMEGLTKEEQGGEADGEVGGEEGGEAGGEAGGEVGGEGEAGAEAGAEVEKMEKNEGENQTKENKRRGAKKSVTSKKTGRRGKGGQNVEAKNEEVVAEGNQNEETVVKSDPNEETVVKSDPNEETVVKSDPNKETVMKSDPNEETVVKSDQNKGAVVKSDPNEESVVKSDQNKGAVTEGESKTDEHAKVGSVSRQMNGKRYAHLTFRTIKNCVEAKKALEKENFLVTFSAPSKANVCLWVGNILKNYFLNTANILNNMFMEFGEVQNIKYVSDKNCLFLQYANVKDAVKARNHMYGIQISNNTFLNIDFSTLGEWEGKQQKASYTRKKLLDSLTQDNGELNDVLESTFKRRSSGFLDSKVMHILKNSNNLDDINDNNDNSNYYYINNPNRGNLNLGNPSRGHPSRGNPNRGHPSRGHPSRGNPSYVNHNSEVRLKRHDLDKNDEYTSKKKHNRDNNSTSVSIHRRKNKLQAVDSYRNNNSGYDKTSAGGGENHYKYEKKDSRRASKRKGTLLTSDHTKHRPHLHPSHHRSYKKRRNENSEESAIDDTTHPMGYSSRHQHGTLNETVKGIANHDNVEEESSSDFNSLDDVELNDYNEIQKTVSFYVNQKYKCDFISNFYDGNPELKIYPKLNVETKSDVHNLMNVRNSCLDYSIWQLGPTVTQKKKFLHICEHFSKKKNIPVIIDKNFTIFIVPMKEDYLKDLGIDNPDFMYAFVLLTKKL
ncbi:hypothetical protein, conserved [Plasmodium gonderi]|uniref:RRM domain-containing protein n=1 Tax=Plasmodium gonderi TaxID=77519 RepID=A0A1Y1JCH4_PLAGO|nr:hypothetical protein, conserved [Plasmodium gonderi]GAW79378.1 hypothetical protein, conserved [Plasmodium gonderi]